LPRKRKGVVSAIWRQIADSGSVLHLAPAEKPLNFRSVISDHAAHTNKM
jgi:hypothetical protein